jgi:hypothetical protein
VAALISSSPIQKWRTRECGEASCAGRMGGAPEKGKHPPGRTTAGLGRIWLRGWIIFAKISEGVAVPHQ